MALAHVQTQYVAASAATSISRTLTLTAANAVVANAMTYASVTTITPDGTNPDTLTERVSRAGTGGLLIKQFSAYSVVGGSTTYKLNFDVSASLASLFVTEISGMATSGAFDQSASTDRATASTHASGTTGTTTQADEIAVAAVHANSSGTFSSFTADSSFLIPTNGDFMSVGTTGVPSGVAYLIVAATGTYAVTFSHTESSDGDALIGTYKAAATSPAVGSYRASPLHPGRGLLSAARFYRTPRSLELPLTRFVQSAGASTGAATQSTITVTLNGVVAGNALLVMVSFGATTDVNDTVTDGGDLFTAVDVAFDGVNGQGLKTWYALNSLGGNVTISAHFTAPEAFLLIIVHEVTGLASLDKHAMALQASPGTGTDGITSGSVTPAANGEYLFGGTVDTAGAISDTQGTGYNARILMNVASQQQGLSEDQIQGTAGAIAATFTQTVNHRALTAIMTFTPATPLDPAVMATMNWPWRLITFSPPKVAASGMTPPDRMPD